MQTKVVCPVCGEVAKTYSINTFRHCGAQYSVEANLLAGEQAKYAKMVAKEGKTPEVKAPEVKVPEVKAPAKKEKVVEPIIEEKPPEVVKPKPQKRKVKAHIEEKAPIAEPEANNFGFF